MCIARQAGSTRPCLSLAWMKLDLWTDLTAHALQVSSAMGFGFRCGFLGLLHMEIVQERLEREYDLDLIVTSPTVVYRCNLTKGETMVVQNPTLLPDAGARESIEEPFVRCLVLLCFASRLLECFPCRRHMLGSTWAGIGHSVSWTGADA